MAALIEDHGIIGDLHTAALVSTDGDIDWLCLPRFDSPSVFASILDDERGGRFTVRCTGATRVKQMYLPDSNVLVTRFLGEHFVGEVVDFMVPHEQGSSRRGASQLVRLVRAVRGRVDVEIPFNAPSDRPCRLFLYRDAAPTAAHEVIEIPACDQYTIAADAFAAAVLSGAPTPVSLEDSVRNMRVLDALVRSAEDGAWQAM